MTEEFEDEKAYVGHALAGDTLVFKEADEPGRPGRVGLLRGRGEIARVAHVLGVEPAALEAVAMQPSALDLERLVSGKVVRVVVPGTDVSPFSVYLDENREVVALGSASTPAWAWPQIRKFLLAHRRLEIADQHRQILEISGEGDPSFTYRVIDGPGEYRRFQTFTQEPFGAPWFAAREIPLIKPE